MNTQFLKHRYPLLLAILLAAALQTILLVRSPTISADGIIFTGIARDLARDPVAAFREHDQHPGFPAAMLATTRIAQALGYRAEPGAWMLGGRIVCFVCGLLSVWVVWLFTRALYDERAANIAAFVWAMLPLPRSLATDAQSDVPHMLLWLTAAWLAAVAVKTDRLGPLVGAAAVSAAAFWIRPEGLEVLVVSLLFVGWQGVRRQWTWRRVVTMSAAVAGVTIVIVAPYAIVSGKITSKQLPFFKQQAAPTFIAQQAEVSKESPPEVSESLSAPVAPPVNASATEVPAPPGPSHAAGELAAKPPAEAAAEETATVKDQVVTHAPGETSAPIVVAELTPAKAPEPARRYSLSLVAKLAAGGMAALVECFCYGFRFVFIPFYLLGQWEMIRRQTSKTLIAFLWTLALLHMAALVWVYFVSGYISSRHVLPLVGLAMPFVALGVLYVEEKLTTRWPVPAPRIAVATLAACSLAVLPYAVRAYNREFVPVIEATRWINQRAESGSGIVCNSPYVGYYGALPTTILGPDALSLEAALARGDRGVQYDYAVLHVNAHDYRPQWYEQLQQRYRVVREYDDPIPARAPRKVVVFEAIEAQARRKAEGPRS
jgi:hypothetical protein